MSITMSPFSTSSLSALTTPTETATFCQSQILLSQLLWFHKFPVLYLVILVVPQVSSHSTSSTNKSTSCGVATCGDSSIIKSGQGISSVTTPESNPSVSPSPHISTMGGGWSTFSNFSIPSL